VTDLWRTDDAEPWRDALDAYPGVIARQGVPRLPELDAWYRLALPAAIGTRPSRFVTHEELVRTTEWKMARGVWRQRNLVLVRSNDPATVEDASRQAYEVIDVPTKSVTCLTALAGVGPATASAVLAAAAPDRYPFFDEVVARQVAELSPDVTFTLPYYRRYAELLLQRAERLGAAWTPALVERALWAHAGGKAGAPA